MLTASGVSLIHESQTMIVSELPPQIQVALSASRNPVLPSDEVVYRVQYSNLGTTVAPNSLAATVPEGTAFVSATGGGTVLDGVVSWPILLGGGLNGSREFTVTINIAAGSVTVLEIIRCRILGSCGSSCRICSRSPNLRIIAVIIKGYFGDMRITCGTCIFCSRMTTVIMTLSATVAIISSCRVITGIVI